MKVADYENRTIFGIEEEDGKRFIHFYGYGYVTDGEDEHNCRLLEYTFFCAPIEDVLGYKGGLIGYETDRSENIKTYITDYTEDELVYIYEHYDNGKMPVEIKEEDILSAPIGVYIV